MRQTLVGSQAARLWFADFREPNDWDFFSREKIDGAERFWHPYLEGWDWGYAATPNELYTIKASHLYWSNRWVKHARDAIWFQEHGCELIPELHDLLYLIWVEHYGKKRARLRKGDTAETFFTASVRRLYDHDSLHASIAYGEEPMFNRILMDGEAVAVDRAKFDALSLDEKYMLVREEVYATALERKVIPSLYKENPLRAYRWALEQTVTSYSKGWFPRFIVENLHVLNEPDVDYIARHSDNSDRLILLGE